MRRLFYLLGFFAILLASNTPEASGQSGVEISILDINGQPTSSITDGDTITIQVTLPDSSNSRLVVVELENPQIEAGRCIVEPGTDLCNTLDIVTLGWAWNPGGSPAGEQILRILVDGSPVGQASLQVRPRPVVMVHGFSSSWQAWTTYLGPDGYLARAGIPGYAVGDGQFEGVMNTGNISDPQGNTNTIAENAAILAAYIQQVKKSTGAQMVDLLAHSMGGLISRYYIDALMQPRDVAQLIMLGSPMAGTACANLPASLDLYLPAVLEIRPQYVNDIFNRQFYHRHGVPFHALAGIPIIRPVQSPCTGVPSDIAVSRESVGGIPLDLTELPILHTELNTSQVVFGSYVLPLLQTSPGGYEEAPDTPPSVEPAADLQFSRVYTGHIDPGGETRLAIQLEPGLLVANFAMFDTTRSLTTTVQGASGNVINLDVDKNGLVQVDDPGMLLYLGYGFENPKPGAWVITIQAGEDTPPAGADYALVARFQGGYDFQARVEPVVVSPGETVKITAGFNPPLDDFTVEEASGLIRTAGTDDREIALVQQGNTFSADWTPSNPGIYAIDLLVRGTRPDGTIIERSSFLAVQVQPRFRAQVPTVLIGLAILSLCMLAVAVVVVLLLIRRFNKAGPKPG